MLLFLKYVQSTAHQTNTLWVMYSSYFKGISANIELQELRYVLLIVL
jgi:hypothetical protein